MCQLVDCEFPMYSVLHSNSFTSWTVEHITNIMDDEVSPDRETLKWWAIQCPNATEEHLRKGIVCSHDAVRYRSKMIACVRFPWLIVECCGPDGVCYVRELLIGLLGGNRESLQYF